MNNRFSIELLVVVIAILLFYARIAQLRGRKKRYEREFALKRRKVKGRSKGAALPAKDPWSSNYIVKSWLLVALGIALMLAGFVAYSQFTVFGISLTQDAAFIEAYSKYWYLAVSVGVLVLAMSITIAKPRLDEPEN